MVTCGKTIGLSTEIKVFFFINMILTTNANVFNIILTMLSTCLPVQKEVGALNVEFCTSEYQGKPYVVYRKI